MPKIEVVSNKKLVNIVKDAHQTYLAQLNASHPKTYPNQNAPYDKKHLGDVKYNALNSSRQNLEKAYVSDEQLISDVIAIINSDKNSKSKCRQTFTSALENLLAEYPNYLGTLYTQAIDIIRQTGTYQHNAVDQPKTFKEFGAQTEQRKELLNTLPILIQRIQTALNSIKNLITSSSKHGELLAYKTRLQTKLDNLNEQLSVIKNTKPPQVTFEVLEDLSKNIEARIAELQKENEVNKAAELLNSINDYIQLSNNYYSFDNEEIRSIKDNIDKFEKAGTEFLTNANTSVAAKNSTERALSHSNKALQELGEVINNLFKFQTKLNSSIQNVDNKSSPAGTRAIQIKSNPPMYIRSNEFMLDIQKQINQALQKLKSANFLEKLAAANYQSLDEVAKLLHEIMNDPSFKAHIEGMKQVFSSLELLEKSNKEYMEKMKDTFTSFGLNKSDNDVNQHYQYELAPYYQALTRYKDLLQSVMKKLPSDEQTQQLQAEYNHFEQNISADYRLDKKILNEIKIINEYIELSEQALRSTNPISDAGKYCEAEYYLHQAEELLKKLDMEFEGLQQNENTKHKITPEVRYCLGDCHEEHFLPAKEKLTKFQQSQVKTTSKTTVDQKSEDELIKLNRITSKADQMKLNIESYLDEANAMLEIMKYSSKEGKKTLQNEIFGILDLIDNYIKSYDTYCRAFSEKLDPKNHSESKTVELQAQLHKHQKLLTQSLAHKSVKSDSKIIDRFSNQNDSSSLPTPKPSK